MGYLERLDGWLPSLDACLILRVLFGYNWVGNRKVTLSYQGHFTKLCYFGGWLPYNIGYLEGYLQVTLYCKGVLLHFSYSLGYLIL